MLMKYWFLVKNTHKYQYLVNKVLKYQFLVKNHVVFILFGMWGCRIKLNENKTYINTFDYCERMRKPIQNTGN